MFISLTTYGQKSIPFDSFVKLFPKTSLPTVVKYSDAEFQTEYYTPDDTTIKDSVPFHDHVLPKDSFLIVEYELVKTFLLADTEKVSPLWPDNSPQSDTIFPTYYISSRLAINKNFVCIIYERQFISGSNPYAEKYLCTLTNTGKIIDKILLASANYSGTGMLDKDYRVPWFPDVQSSIDNDLKIILKDGNNGEIINKINDRGRIIKASH